MSKESTSFSSGKYPANQITIIFAFTLMAQSRTNGRAILAGRRYHSPLHPGRIHSNGRTQKIYLSPPAAIARGSTKSKLNNEDLCKPRFQGNGFLVIYNVILSAYIEALNAYIVAMSLYIKAFAKDMRIQTSAIRRRCVRLHRDIVSVT